MPEHSIRLHRAWEAVRHGVASRIDLPASWSEGEVPESLSRRFHRPRIDPATERVVLGLIDVDGLREVYLNGRGIEVSSGAFEIPLESSGRSGFEILLKLDPESVPRGVPWGRIAVIVKDA